MSQQWATALARADWTLVPDKYRHPLRLYVEQGKVPGAFLTAFLCNDAHEVVVRADADLTLADLRWLVIFCDRYLPRESFGRPELVAFWEDTGGLAGLFRVAANG